MSDDKQIAKAKSKPQAFNGLEFDKIERAIENMAQTQLGVLKETWDAEELVLLFVPHEYRKALRLVYEVEDQAGARGEIWIDLCSILGRQEWIFEAGGSIDSGIMRIYFRRDFMPNGFVTPSPLFGTRNNPIKTLQGVPPPNLGERFMENAKLLLRITCEWTMVRWAAKELQNSLRTPAQMRYVWPAIYPITKAAELNMNLSTPSLRAGINAMPSAIVRPYLGPTNDVVANSALMSINDEYLTRHRRHDVLVTDAAIKIEGTTVKFTANV